MANELQEVLQWLNDLDERDYKQPLDRDELMREIRGMILEVECMIGELK